MRVQLQVSAFVLLFPNFHQHNDRNAKTQFFECMRKRALHLVTALVLTNMVVCVCGGDVGVQKWVRSRTVVSLCKTKKENTPED